MDNLNFEQKIQSYLPFKVCGTYILSEVIYVENDEVRKVELTDFNVRFFVNYCKGHFRKISDLTSPITVIGINEGKEFVPMFELAKLGESEFFEDNNVKMNYSEELGMSSISWFSEKKQQSVCFSFIEKVRCFYLETRNQDKVYISNQLMLFHFLQQCGFWIYDDDAFTDGRILDVEKMNLKNEF